MSIFDLFGKAPDTSRNPNLQAPVNTGPGQIPEGTGTGTGGNAATAANGVTPTLNPDTGTEASKSPFAEFEKLWETPTVDPTKGPEPLYKIDPNQIMSIANKTDFKGLITKEQRAAMATGGQAGMEAMLDAIQTVGSNIYANAAVAATKIAESGIVRSQKDFEGKLPSFIKNQNLSESLGTKNPALNDPAVAPLVGLVKNQMSQKYPNASAAELQSMAEKYLLAAGNAFAPQADTSSQQQQGSAGEDWEAFFK